MQQVDSLYKCKCGITLSSAPGKRIGCMRCNQPMIEEVVGIVQKDVDTSKNEVEQKVVEQNQRAALTAPQVLKPKAKRKGKK